MKRYSFLLLLFFSFSRLYAQFDAKVIPIDSVLLKRFQSDNINVIIGIPTTYKVTECTFCLVRQDLYCASYSTEFPNFSQLHSFMLKNRKKGDRLIFREIIVMKGDRKLKLASQIYSFQ